MEVLYHSVRQFSKNLILSNFTQFNRNITLSATSRVIEIISKQEGNTLTIEGVEKPNYNLHRQIQLKTGACALCELGLDVKHTDVLILSQFLRPDGCMLPRRITGLCKIQQKRVTTMVAMAQKAGLMPNLAPAYSKKDPKKRYQWKKFNTYYDENTILHRYKNYS